MGKVLKVVGTVLAVAGFVAATIATFGGSAALAGVLGVTTTTLSTITTAVTIGGAVAGALGAALTKGPKLEDIGANARGQAFVDPNALGGYAFGETAVPAAIIFEENYGDESELVANVAAHCWHEIDSYQSLHVDGELVSFSGDAATGDYAGVLTWKRKTGASGQTAISLPSTVWPSDAEGAGVAHSAFVWNFKDQDILTGGVPTRLTIRVRGALLYDPRLDTTAGGSGSHRYDDPSTWEYNDGNAALVLLRYVIGERAANGDIIWGVGEPQTDVDLASFIAAANVCDETRDGVPRYRLGGYFPTTNNHEAFFDQWEASTGGKVAIIGGKRFCWVPHDDLTSMDTITDADILRDGGVSHQAGPDPRQLINTVRGRYISAADLFQGAPYPEVEESALVSDDGGRRIQTIDYGWVQDIETCERLARYAIKRSRYGRLWTLAMGWKGVLYDPFTVVTLNISETDYEDQLARIIDKTVSIDGVSIVTFQEEDASIYDDTPALGTPPAKSTIPNRVDRIGTYTPRLFDGTSIDEIISSGRDKTLADGVMAEQSGGETGRTLAIGAADGFVRDGDSVSFSQDWDAPPIVRFGAGGLSHSSGLSEPQQQVYRALNLTKSGFTASLKLKSTGSGGTTSYDDGPGSLVGGTPGWQIEKSSDDEDTNDNYEFEFSVNANDGEIVEGEPVVGMVSVGFYTRTLSGGAWVKRDQKQYNVSGTYIHSITVDGLDSDSAFGIHRESGALPANDVTAFIEVRYEKTTINEVTATPAGASSVPYWLIGNAEGV
ncbi:hypothetical protein PUV54_00060 [Hyphococcus flavus]|uniref:Tip attachment protein J domain-containing protein n=1 Tax=Hyphococcus flavus TaxID=1866326 RepID=A0AAF0CH77_9PROT|nr:hypothetical protein [Hyphococcus flavus]WDI31587.1 hypothetical protein PUV54_00060 [Hyphococcus flavus]